MFDVSLNETIGGIWWLGQPIPYNSYEIMKLVFTGDDFGGQRQQNILALIKRIVFSQDEKCQNYDSASTDFWCPHRTSCNYRF